MYFPSLFPSVFVVLLFLTIDPVVVVIGVSASRPARDSSQKQFNEPKGSSLVNSSSELSLVSHINKNAVSLKNQRGYVVKEFSSHDASTENDAGSSASTVLVRYSQSPGEMGNPVYLENPTPEEAKLIADGYRDNGFNQFISDLISVNRTLSDYRSTWCQRPHLQSRNLLSTSIIISFYNEAWSTLLRAVHSILDRTPPALLTEIILVDDFSDRGHLKQPLDTYVKFLPKVKLLRLKKREGLIRARMIGARTAAGPVLTFLDSHVEVTEGWLEPLVGRITLDKTNVVSPVIHSIDGSTFEFRFRNKSATYIGSFQWSLGFQYRQAPDTILKRLKTPDEPLPTPILGLGIFAIHMDFFFQIGGFDESLEIWGGENLEISFKAWMCGGRLEICPCSHIGHVYRNYNSYSLQGFKTSNLIRIASIWLDEYAQYYYATIFNNFDEYGVIHDGIKTRSRLRCKSFDWYMQNVAYDHFNPKLSIAEGEIRNLAFGAESCLDLPYAKAYQKPIIFPCHNFGPAGNQHWYFTNHGELRRDNLCLDEKIDMVPCSRQATGSSQIWHYIHEEGFLLHNKSRKCLAMDERDVLSMQDCEAGTITLRWQLEHFNQHNANNRFLLENKSFKQPR